MGLASCILHVCDNRRMEPAWERHDFAAYAASLPGVRRMLRAHRVLVLFAIFCIGIPLVIALAGEPVVLLALTPLISIVFSVVSAICAQRAATVERLAIARWVIAAEKATQPDQKGIRFWAGLIRSAVPYASCTPNGRRGFGRSSLALAAVRRHFSVPRTSDFSLAGRWQLVLPRDCCSAARALSIFSTGARARRALMARGTRL